MFDTMWLSLAPFAAISAVVINIMFSRILAPLFYCIYI